MEADGQFVLDRVLESREDGLGHVELGQDLAVAGREGGRVALPLVKLLLVL